MRSIIFLIIGLTLEFEAFAMDIIKTLKVTEQPKPQYHRKMDQAIRVQLTKNAIHQHLKKLNHPCCQR